MVDFAGLFLRSGRRKVGSCAARGTRSPAIFSRRPRRFRREALGRITNSVIAAENFSNFFLDIASDLRHQGLRFRRSVKRRAPTSRWGEASDTPARRRARTSARGGAACATAWVAPHQAGLSPEDSADRRAPSRGGAGIYSVRPAEARDISRPAVR